MAEAAKRGQNRSWYVDERVSISDISFVRWHAERMR